MDIFPGHDSKEFMRTELNERFRKTPDMKELREYDNHLVFVYGTLQKGKSNNHLLRNAKFLGRGRTLNQNYCMYEAGSFPVLRKLGKDEGSYVYGEVYAVSPEEMMRLDALESNGSMYTREQVRVKLSDQPIITPEKTRAFPFEKCWTYFGEEDFWSFDNMRETVPDYQNDDNKAEVGYLWTGKK